MRLSVFHPDTLSHYRSSPSVDRFEHSFGGDSASFGLRFINSEPLHLVYRLNQADPAVGPIVAGLNWLPLVYHFSYASMDGTLIYRVVGDGEIEVIAPAEAEFDLHVPYANYPRAFPKVPIAFDKQAYNPAVAEDALSLSAVFGLGQLSPTEMQRAIEIAEKTCGTISGFDLPDWTPEDVLRNVHREPFVQGAPSKSCDNPNCTAEIAYRVEAHTLPMDEVFQELTGQSSLTIEAHDVRRNSMRVFAIQQPGQGEEVIWGDEPVQLVFEVCECCQCIRVSHQCT